MIQTRYRRDYDGEFVIVDTVIAGGQTHQKREWIPNPVLNHHLSGRAAVIGSRVHADKFQHTRLARHRGGLLGKKRLQTYGTADLWQDMRFDFFCSTTDDEISRMIDQDYDQTATVYSSARNCLRHPGRLYLVPHMPVIDDLALPIYLAAFDGHQEIFLLGYCKDTPAGSRSWQLHVNDVIKAYQGTAFVFVGVESNVPESWRTHSHVRCMKFRDFVFYCDV